MDYDELVSQFARELEAACSELGGADNIEHTISIPKPEFGDICTSVAFELAKKAGRNPKLLAEQVAGNLRLAKLFSRVAVVGGYINCTLRDDAFLEEAARILEKGTDYAKHRTIGLTVLIEYPSVNPNKPWHLGHLRNALLGDAMANLFACTGYATVRADYIDDLGLQVAESVWGYRNLGKLPEAGKFDVQLGLQYVEVSKRFESGEIEKEVRQVLGKMEAQDNDISAAARELATKCLLAQYETAFSLGLYHDILIFESDIAKFLVAEGLEIIKSSEFVGHEAEGKNAGCLVLNASLSFPERDPRERKGMVQEKSGQKVLLRSNGTMTYLAKDIIFHLWKFGLLKSRLKFKDFVKQPNGKAVRQSSADGEPQEISADLIINIIGAEQSTHQEAIKEFISLRNPGKTYIHLAYAHARYADGSPESGVQGLESRVWSSEDVKTGLFLGFRPLAFQMLLSEKFSTPAGIDRPMAKSSEAKLPISQKERPPGEIEHAMHARAMREAHSSKGISEDLKTGRPQDPKPETRPTRRFSGREGTWLGYIADDLIAKTEEKIQGIVEGRNLDGLAVHRLAVCSIKYAFLKISPEKELVFSWEDALNFSANSGVYIMYSYARICRLLEKADPNELKAPEGLKLNPEEHLLLRKLMEFRGVVARGCRDFKPSHIPSYLFELASQFTQFYEKWPILKETDARERAKRLLICKATAVILESGMNLLGIETVEKM